MCGTIGFVQHTTHPQVLPGLSARIAPRPFRNLQCSFALHYTAAGCPWSGNRDTAPHAMSGWKRIGNKQEKRTRDQTYGTSRLLLPECSARYTNPEDLVIQSSHANINIVDAQHRGAGVGPLAVMQRLDCIRQSFG